MRRLALAIAIICGVCGLGRAIAASDIKSVHLLCGRTVFIEKPHELMTKICRSAPIESVVVSNNTPNVESYAHPPHNIEDITLWNIIWHDAAYNTHLCGRQNSTYDFLAIQQQINVWRKRIWINTRADTVSKILCGGMAVINQINGPLELKPPRDLRDTATYDSGNIGPKLHFRNPLLRFGYAFAYLGCLKDDHGLLFECIGNPPHCRGTCFGVIQCFGGFLGPSEGAASGAGIGALRDQVGPSSLTYRAPSLPNRDSQRDESEPAQNDGGIRDFVSSLRCSRSAPIGAQIGGVVVLSLIAGFGLTVGIWPIRRLRRLGRRGNRLVRISLVMGGITSLGACFALITASNC